MRPLPPPQQIKADYPLHHNRLVFVREARAQAARLIHRQDRRIAVLVGPCSIHQECLALSYAHKVRDWIDRFGDQLFLVMRCFLEKPRTCHGWKGFLYDPHLDHSCQIEEGLRRSRQLLLDLCDLQIPAATELLDPLLFPYYSDLICWGVIGARTVGSQIHRQLASLAPFPVGFKNGIDGSVDQAFHGIEMARRPQGTTSIDEGGRLSHLMSNGNPDTHLILRGSETGTNYDHASIAQILGRNHQQNRLLVDCAHGNSQKNPMQQIPVFEEVFQQIQEGNEAIMGMMVESHLTSDCRLSLTDPCLGSTETEQILYQAYKGCSPSKRGA